jgi:hypothetical protein
MASAYRLDRTLIRVSGPDARAFLQGLLTQNIDRLTREMSLYAALLSPQGKLIADMLVWAEPDGGVLIDADSARGEVLMGRLAMYKLRAQVGLADVSGAVSVVVSEAPFEGAVADPRFPDGALGWRGLAAEAKSLADGADGFAQWRIKQGVPDLAGDCGQEEVFALEALLEELHGVDFQKGCFVGQENVSRMKRRATTRRKFCPIMFDGPAPAPGTPVFAGEVELGSVRSGMAGRALALLRLDRAVGQTLRADALAVRLDPPPWLILPAREDGRAES